jgi:signal transduction histidine kinase
MSLVAIGRSIQLLDQRIVGGRLLVLATLFSVMGILFSTAQASGLFPGNFFVLHAIQVGLFGNIIALHLAIAARNRAQDLLHFKAQQEAIQAAAKATREQQAREEQANFISMLAHELKTPLAGISAAADNLIILLGKIPPEADLRFDRIRRAVRRIDAIAERYLQLDPTGKARLHPKFTETTLTKLLDLAREQFVGNTARLQSQACDDIRLTCDPNLIATAILNLIDNAMKYSPLDQAVELSARIVADREVAIEVADRGPGVPGEMRAAIFDRYFRLPTKSAVPGIGVGLTLTKSIAEAHGGSVEVLDRTGGGAIFRLTLPLHRP